MPPFAATMDPRRSKVLRGRWLISTLFVLNVCQGFGRENRHVGCRPYRVSRCRAPSCRECKCAQNVSSQSARFPMNQVAQPGRLGSTCAGALDDEHVFGILPSGKREFSAKRHTEYYTLSLQRGCWSCLGAAAGLRATKLGIDGLRLMGSGACGGHLRTTTRSSKQKRSLRSMRVPAVVPCLGLLPWKVNPAH